MALPPTQRSCWPIVAVVAVAIAVGLAITLWLLRGPADRLLAQLEFRGPNSNRQRIENELLALGEDALPALVAWSSSSDSDTATFCLDVIEKLGPKARSALPALLQIMATTKSGLLQLVLERTIGALVTPADVLLLLAKRGEPVLNPFVLRWLGDAGGPTALAVLERVALSARDWETRHQAIEGLLLRRDPKALGLLAKVTERVGSGTETPGACMDAVARALIRSRG